MFLNNLFLNINIAHCLLTINFTIIDTTRKNAIGLPTSLTNILVKDKEIKKNDKKRQPLAYNSVLAVVIYKYLYFMWQDNNSVLAIITTHSLHRSKDRVRRERKRLLSTSTNTK